jgi:paraquat-inducible protein A
MTIIKLNRGGGHTILAGVRELYEAHMLPLALLVFFASITVPVLKILGLTLMSWCAWRGSSTRIVDRARLFRLIDFIGRWSMIDVFMISILVAMVHFGGLANINADPGVFAFASVVVLTIFAANCFDPRVMWDAAGLNGVAAAGKPKGGTQRHAMDSETESVGA